MPIHPVALPSPAPSATNGASDLSIVVPVLDEAAHLVSRLQALAPLRQRGAEVIVVDGGSQDATPEVAKAWADAVLRAPRGRAAQMNAGAEVARRRVLLFLHADTTLPPQADQAIAQAMAAGARWGRFDVRIEGRHPLLPMVAALMNLRSRWSGLATGDQALFVERCLFRAAGGFAALPLMEDLDLSRRLRRIAPPACLREQVQTAGRRWDRYGLWRTIWLMWRLRAAWALGADPAELARRYGYRPRAGAAVAVLADAPVDAGAVRAQRALLRHAIATVRAAAIGPLTLWCAPDETHRHFQAWRRMHGVVLQPQTGSDRGQRMAAAVQHHFAARAAPLILLGPEDPALTPEHLQAVADALQSHGAALWSADDGSSVLLGLRAPVPGMFEGVAWGTRAGAQLVRERLHTAGVSLWEGPLKQGASAPADRTPRWSDSGQSG
ncbi:TIGR04283 family arsenosugar biosynthesis glycosyltransferase [uncultured Hydrogenophaga sp.]|uniref:TIGR04283 family arsenosugar biosynthesis glycosyltransferase n=1 Tax=uncultured Hydrogenophaga sp. TaxID=199683 RepID=UPI00265F15A3|nr:TIGR04283 family arsenosugar biosynthesis glycosyltransferase [uncultured Hydrogenophaga sp.]